VPISATPVASTSAVVFIVVSLEQEPI